MPRLFAFWLDIWPARKDRTPKNGPAPFLQSPRMLPHFSRRHYIGYAFICLIWGSTWGAIRLLVRDVPPLRAAAVRFFLAAIVLLGITFYRNGKLSLTRNQWRALIVLGFTMMGLPYGLLFWAEYRISSSMTAVLFSTCPLFVALFTPLLTQVRVPRRAVFAMVIALGGISVLFYTGLSASVYLLLGGGAVMLAVVISSWSAVFAKREMSDVNPLIGTAVQFCVSAAVLFAGSLIFERDRPSDWNQTSILALVFLTVFGSVIAFSLYYWLLRSMQAYQLSTMTLIVPVIAMLESALLLHEPVPLLMVGAAVLVLVAVGAVLKAEDDKPLSLKLEPPAVEL
jgi:drug/metabolite transporter (DMT)-like permease